jgi:hypothetical protein
VGAVGGAFAAAGTPLEAGEESVRSALTMSAMMDISSAAKTPTPARISRTSLPVLLTCSSNFCWSVFSVSMMSPVGIYPA